MIDLSSFSTQIGRDLKEVDGWFRPVFDRGRSAVFVDTGFLRALILPDQWSDLAQLQFAGAKRTNFYTTTFVFGELVRKIAKSKVRNAGQRHQWFDECRSLLVEPGTIGLCSPPAELTKRAYKELLEAKSRPLGLDLCDAVTVKVMEYAQHRRIFSFDRKHLLAFGALVEPNS